MTVRRGAACFVAVAIFAAAIARWPRATLAPAAREPTPDSIRSAGAELSGPNYSTGRAETTSDTVSIAMTGARDNRNPNVLVGLTVESLLESHQTAQAASLVSNMAGGSLRAHIDNTVFERIARALARDSRQAASDWLLALPASDERNYAIGTFATEWATQDPAEALDWAAQLAPADGRIETMRRVFSRWTDRNVTAASEWLAGHAQDPAIDPLIADLVRDHPAVQANFRTAATLAAAVGDADLQKELVSSVLRRWVQTDRTAAGAFLAQSTLPLAQKAYFSRAFGL